MVIRREGGRRVATFEVDSVELINCRERVVRTLLRDGTPSGVEPWVETHGYSRADATPLS